MNKMDKLNEIGFLATLVSSQTSFKCKHESRKPVYVYCNISHKIQLQTIPTNIKLFKVLDNLKQKPVSHITHLSNNSLFL